MGTRGLIVIKYKNKHVSLYVHFDTYSEGLGVDLVEFLQSLFNNKDDYERFLQNLLYSDIVKDDPKPYTIDILYELVQNSIVLHDNEDFINDAVLCEYVYEIDFDNDRFQGTHFSQISTEWICEINNRNRVGNYW